MCNVLCPMVRSCQRFEPVFDKVSEKPNLKKDINL